MHVDFHHAVICAVVRFAGQSHEEASTVADAARYVADAKGDRALDFTTRERYTRGTSAHKIFDFKKTTTAPTAGSFACRFISSMQRRDSRRVTVARARSRNRMMCKPNISSGAANVTHVDRGPGSWKMQALGADPDDESDVDFAYTDSFLQSDWKQFHGAVQYQRLFIVHDLLPTFGLCAS